MTVALVWLTTSIAVARGDRVADSAPVPIIGGGPTEPDGFAEVVAVSGGFVLCTGVAVAPNLVLTAAHCLDQLSSDAALEVLTGDEVELAEANSGVAFGAHPDFDRSAGAHDIFDYGFVVTERELSPPFAIPIQTQEEWDYAMQFDREVVLVGYGDDPAVSGGLGIKREVAVTITGFSPQGLEFNAGGDGGDTCEGDSGGPAFVRMPDGTLRLLGITSRGSNPCGNGGTYGSPTAALCWVRDETGIDLTGECSSCDCLDTTPPAPPDPDGCNCGSRQSNSKWTPLWMLWLLGTRRQRRSVSR